MNSTSPLILNKITKPKNHLMWMKTNTWYTQQDLPLQMWVKTPIRYWRDFSIFVIKKIKFGILLATDSCCWQSSLSNFSLHTHLYNTWYWLSTYILCYHFQLNNPLIQFEEWTNSFHFFRVIALYFFRDLEQIKLAILLLRPPMDLDLELAQDFLFELLLNSSK